MKVMRLEEVIANGFPPGPWKKELTPEELKEAYALARAAFTAEDLHIPAEQVLAEMEENQKAVDQQKK